MRISCLLFVVIHNGGVLSDLIVSSRHVHQDVVAVAYRTSASESRKSQKSLNSYEKPISRPRNIWANTVHVPYREECSIKVSFYLGFRKNQETQFTKQVFQKSSVCIKQDKFFRWKRIRKFFFSRQLNNKLYFQNMFDLFLHSFYFL